MIENAMQCNIWIGVKEMYFSVLHAWGVAIQNTAVRAVQDWGKGDANYW